MASAIVEGATLVAVLWFGGWQLHKRTRLRQITSYWATLYGISHRNGRRGYAACVVGFGLMSAFGSNNPGHIATIGMILIPLGSFGLIVGLSNRERLQRVQEMDDTEQREVIDGDVIVSGTVESAEETLETPFSRREAVAYKANVWRSRLLEFLSRRYKMAKWWTDSTRFYVKTDDEKVLVDPDGAYFEPMQVNNPGTDTVIVKADHQNEGRAFRDGDSIPSGIRRELDEHGLDHLGANDNIKRPFKVLDSCIQPGDSVTVIGTATGGSDASGLATTVVRADGEDEGIIEGDLEQTRNDLVLRGDRLLKSGATLYLIGLALVVFG